MWIFPDFKGVSFMKKLIKVYNNGKLIGFVEEYELLFYTKQIYCFKYYELFRSIVVHDGEIEKNSSKLIASFSVDNFAAFSIHKTDDHFYISFNAHKPIPSWVWDQPHWTKKETFDDEINPFD